MKRAGERDFGASWFGDDATVLEREVWECAVAAIGEDDWFSAHAIRHDNGRGDRDAYCEFYKDQVAEQDASLLIPGALFWWVIEVVRKASGHHEGRSAIRFRRVGEGEATGEGWVESVREAWLKPLPELDGAAR